MDKRRKGTVKQIVCGEYGSGKSRRSLEIASGYNGTVIYYSWGTAPESYYGERMPELFRKFRAVDGGGSGDAIIPGNKYFIKHKRILSRTAGGEWYTTPAKHTNLPEFYRALDMGIRPLLLVIDDNAWDAVHDRSRVLYELYRSHADVIINIAHPEDILPLCPEQPTRIGNWDTFRASERYEFTSCDWDTFFRHGNGCPGSISRLKA